MSNKKAKIGDVIVDVVSSEDLSHDADVTTNSVEKGQDIADHVKAKAPSISISGLITGSDAPSKLQKLKKMQKDGELIKYVGRTMYNNMVIEKLHTSHAVGVHGGYTFSINLVNVRIAESQLVEVKVTPAPQPVKSSGSGGSNSAGMKTSSQVKAMTSKGNQQSKVPYGPPPPPKKKNSTPYGPPPPPRKPVVMKPKARASDLKLQPGGTMKMAANNYVKKKTMTDKLKVKAGSFRSNLKIPGRGGTR